MIIFQIRIPKELLTVNGNKNATYWNLEDGYQANVKESDIYPRRTFGAGIRDSLVTFLGIHLDKAHQLCSLFAPGFRLSLHAPDDLPRLPNDFIHIAPEQDVYISIKPNVITTANGLRKYASQERGCYFKSERELVFFKSYSQSNCELECLANYILRECGCVHFSMPSMVKVFICILKIKPFILPFSGENNTKICTMYDMVCVTFAETIFGQDLVVQQCDCMADCTSISYHVELSQAQSKYFEDDSDDENYDENR